MPRSSLPSTTITCSYGRPPTSTSSESENRCSVDAVLGLDDAEDVGVDVAHDHRRVLHRQLVDRLRRQLDPADPARPAVGDDLDRPVAVPAQQAAADDAQDGERRRVAAQQAELLEPGEDPPLRRRVVDLRLEQGVDRGVGLEDRAPGRPRAHVHAPWRGRTGSAR